MHRLALLLLLAVPPGAAAGQGTPARWTVAAGVGFATFSAVAARHAEAAVSLVPTRSVLSAVSLSRRQGGWELGSGLDVLATALGVEDAALTVVARDASLSRARWHLSAARRVARSGDAEVWMSAGPSLELWSPRGGDARGRAGGSAGIGLRLDAGPVALENTITGSISGSPLRPSELPDGYRARVVRTVEIGLAVRIGL